MSLRQAAQQALEAMDKATRFMSDSDYKKLNEAIDTLRAALAEPEQDKFCDTHCTWRDHHPECVRAEPVAHLWRHCETGRTRVVMPDQIVTAEAAWVVVGPLYLGAAPTPRKPLTDGQLRGFFMLTNTAEPLAEGWPGLERFARAVERAHGIKEQEHE